MTGSSRPSSREVSPDVTDSEFESEASPAASSPSEPTSLPYSPQAPLTSTFAVQLSPASQVQNTGHPTTQGSQQPVPNYNDFGRNAYYERQSILIEQQNRRRLRMDLTTQATQASLSQQPGPPNYNERGRDMDYQMQLMLLEQQNNRRLRTDLMTQEAPKDREIDTAKPESQATRQLAPGAPGWTSNNGQTSRLASLADYARLHYQIQQQQQDASASASANAVDSNLSHGQSNEGLYPNHGSNGFHDAQRPNLPRANSNCSSSSQHSAPCNAAATTLLESTLSSEEINGIQLEQRRRLMQVNLQNQLRLRQIMEDAAAEKSGRMPNYYSLPALSNSEPSTNATYSQARYQTQMARRYNASSQYGPHNDSGGVAPYMPSSPPSFSSSNPASRPVGLPEYVSMCNNDQAPFNVAKRSSSESTHDERTCKKSKHAMLSTVEDITASEVENSGQGLELPTESEVDSRMREERREEDAEALTGQDHVIMDGEAQACEKTMDEVTLDEDGTPNSDKDKELLHTEETIRSDGDKASDASSPDSASAKYTIKNCQTPIARNEIFIMGEDTVVGTEEDNENGNNQASPAHSSSTLDDEDENLNDGPLADLKLPALRLPDQIEPSFSERTETNFSDTGISVTTTTFKSGKTKTLLRVGREVGMVRPGRKMRRQGIEIMTKTVVEGGKVTTTTTTALIPLDVDMGGEESDEEEDEL